MSDSEFSNALIHESSPYLLQHAHNPVNWLPWGEKALDLAVTENKLILVSIGYSACHWCHVMEKECFEKEDVAALMNAHFICIKVDREERPDIDQVYMDALQLMTGHGGWPLNCVCLPDQRPVYGGTYFKKEDWISLLNNLSEFWNNAPADAIEYAAKLTAGIRESGNFSAPVPTEEINRKEDLDFLNITMGAWKRHADKNRGGFGGAPKFPLPNSWLFLTRKAFTSSDEELMRLTDLTLHKMAYGGIYDQLGGGFSRYATDANWMIPHFEKMLYDNAQLISLYSESYQRNGVALYKNIVKESLRFIGRELSAPGGGFYSALDADSEGVEGKFYTWSDAEINSLLGSDAELVKTVYHIKEGGNWEHTNILYLDGTEHLLAARLGLTEHEFQVLLSRCKSRLMIHRATRIRPGLDDKILCCWNAMMVKAYADAFRVLRTPEYLDLATLNLHFIFDNFLVQGQLYRTWKDGRVRIPGFLDDYVFLAEACLSVYQAGFDESWITKADELMRRALALFYDESSGMFYYTGADDQLIARKQEVFDNVIPGSCSMAGRVLFSLGTLLSDQGYKDICSRMLLAIRDDMKAYSPSFSNWSLLMLEQCTGVTEIAVCGPDALNVIAKLQAAYLPFVMFMAETGGSSILPLLEGKTGGIETRIYICRDKTCTLPLSSEEEALGWLKVN